jgi:FMN-dependent NADH-azoreductase
MPGKFAMKILHLDSSINHEFSVTRQLSAEIVRQLVATGQGHQLTYRDLVKDEISHLTGEIASGFRSVSERPIATPLLASEQQISDALVSEFLESEMIVVGAPMYNFSVSSQLKAWMDRIAQPGKTFSYTPAGPVGLAGAKKSSSPQRGAVFMPVRDWKIWIFRNSSCASFWASWASRVLNLSVLKVCRKVRT